MLSLLQPVKVKRALISNRRINSGSTDLFLYLLLEGGGGTLCKQPMASFYFDNEPSWAVILTL